MRTKRNVSRSRRKQRKTKRMKGGNNDNKAGILLYDNIHKKMLTVSNQLDQNIGIPKGKIEFGEFPPEAAFRELAEETGIIFNEFPTIAKQFNAAGLKTTVFVVLFPNGSETIHDYVNPSENIHHVKWRTKEDLVNNINYANLTIRTKKYLLSDAILQIFGTNYRETNPPSVTIVNHLENPDLDALIRVDTHTT